jgi:hypothetical protein
MTPSSKGTQVRVQLLHPLSRKTFVALLDSGCNKSTVAKEVVSWYVPQQRGQYRNASGKLEQTCGSIDLPFKLEYFGASRQVNHEFQIAEPLLYPIILGTDFMEEQGIILDFKEHSIHWDGASVPMGTPQPPATVLFAVTNEDGGAGQFLNVEGKQVDIDALVPKDTLSLEQQQRLRAALHRVKVVFVGPVGKLKLPPYVLPVKPGAIPSAQAPYSIPHKLHAPTLKELERLVRLGVLEPDKDSPWAAPAFVIPKKDGSVRFLSDFRRLNKWLERRYFPLTKIQDILRELPRPRFVTTLDLVMGYYSRELAVQSRPFTAIVLPWGKYRYCRLPMGISTAPDEFHAVMTQLLGDLQYVRIYLDDVLILSQTFDEHLQHIEVVLNRLMEAGVVVHAVKSKFCATSVNYLGYNISSEGKRPIGSKVEAIKRLARPRNIRDLRRFIGMVNYYKDMWPSRSSTLAPLTALTSPRVPFRWTQREQKAFDAVKAMISQSAELVYPDFDKPFDIYTDASDYQLGGVLMQEGRPLAFWSQKCDETQRKYATNKKELLSILLMLREFRAIVWGQKIRIFTDHRNSTFQNFSNWTMLRWRLEIEEYGPELIYVEGKDNVVADALSRLPMQRLGESRQVAAAENEIKLLFSLSPGAIGKAQLEGGFEPDEDYVRREVGGVELLVAAKDGRICVPQRLQQPILETYHEWLIHPGITIMTQTIKAAFYWRGMDGYIKRWVQRCQTCATSKHFSQGYGNIPEKVVEVRPWNEIAVDSIGPPQGRW